MLHPAAITSRKAAHLLPQLVIALLSFAALLCAGAENGTKILESVEKFDSCIYQATYSFLVPSLYPPTTMEAMRQSCKNQSEAFKCLKERTKQAPALIRRGVLTFAQNRQRYHKKVCTNLQSELTKNFIRDFACLLDKKLPQLAENDAIFANTFAEIKRLNFNDSALELKYICCNMYTLRKKNTANMSTDCPQAQATFEDTMNSILPSDLSLICEDEEKMLTKVCPSLPPLNVSKSYTHDPSKRSTSAIALYLVATLGEPNDDI